MLSFLLIINLVTQFAIYQYINKDITYWNQSFIGIYYKPRVSTKNQFPLTQQSFTFEH